MKNNGKWLWPAVQKNCTAGQSHLTYNKLAVDAGPRSCSQSLCPNAVSASKTLTNRIAQTHIFLYFSGRQYQCVYGQQQVTCLRTLFLIKFFGCKFYHARSLQPCRIFHLYIFQHALSIFIISFFVQDSSVNIRLEFRSVGLHPPGPDHQGFCGPEMAAGGKWF